MLLKLFDIPRAHNLIGGVWVQADAEIEVIDPSTNKPITSIARGTIADIDAAVNAAQSALVGEWGAMTALERGRILIKVGVAVLNHVEDLAKIEAIDVGKPLTQARADAVALARYMEFYGGAADKITGET
ncbi:aldehyde dehydrogenase family protein, partial [Planktomarina sp.]|nr:aldehyde dehydrogenase family protein [Planktomarina sp.]